MMDAFATERVARMIEGLMENGVAAEDMPDALRFGLQIQDRGVHDEDIPRIVNLALLTFRVGT